MIDIKGNIISKALSLHDNPQMRQDELAGVYDWLIPRFEGGNTLELGAYKGMTSYVFCRVHQSYREEPREDVRHYIVDVFEQGKEDWDWGYGKHTVKMLKNNLGELARFTHIIKSRSLGYNSISTLLTKRFDAVFIDGDHRFATLLLELHMVDYITDNILVHDYGLQAVTAAVDKFCARFGYTVRNLVPNTGLYEIIKHA